MDILETLRGLPSNPIRNAGRLPGPTTQGYEYPVSQGRITNDTKSAAPYNPNEPPTDQPGSPPSPLTPPQPPNPSGPTGPTGPTGPCGAGGAQQGSVTYILNLYADHPGGASAEDTETVTLSFACLLNCLTPDGSYTLREFQISNNVATGNIVDVDVNNNTVVGSTPFSRVFGAGLAGVSAPGLYYTWDGHPEWGTLSIHVNNPIVLCGQSGQPPCQGNHYFATVQATLG